MRVRGPRVSRMVLPLLLLLVGRGAEARCPSWEALRGFTASTSGALRCAELRLSTPGAACRPVAPPPACAAEPSRAILDLAVGALPARGLAPATPALRCQQAIVRATRRYLLQRVPERRLGRRPAPRDALLDGVAAACVGADAAPGAGGACAALRDDGAAPDAGALSRCLVAALEGAIDRALPTAIRPNIVLILTDDQRADSLAFMPATLDRLADRGMRFDNGFVTTPVCGPSRASILSGRYASHHGVRGNSDLVVAAHDFDEDQTFARWLQSVGYRTGFFGKYVNGSQLRPPGAPLGWDVWQAFRGARYLDYELDVDGTLEAFGATPADYSTDLLAARAARFIETHREEPFLLVLAVFAPHLPAYPAERHAGALADLPPARPPNFREASTVGKPGWVQLVRRNARPAEAVDAERRAMLESLLAVDDAVATLLDALDRTGLTDDTAVFFTSDNGYHWGEHWWESKFTGYEESLRVPFLVRHPAAQPVAGRSDAIVLNIDLAPTFAELAGVSPSVRVDGESLLPLLRGEPARRDAFAFESFDRLVVRPMDGVRTERLKLVTTDPQTALPFDEVYDLVDDPFELVNLARDPALAATLAWLRGLRAAVLSR